MRILGIGDHITCGAVIIDGGRLVAAVNEERLVRRKMVMGFPRESIKSVMDMAGLRPDQIDAIAVASTTGQFLEDYVDIDAGLFSLDEGILKGLFFTIGSRSAIASPAETSPRNVEMPCRPANHTRSATASTTPNAM